MLFYIRLIMDEGKIRIRSSTKAISTDLFTQNSTTLKRTAEEFVCDQLKHNFFFRERLALKPVDHVMVYFFPAGDEDGFVEESYADAIQFRIPIEPVKEDPSKPVRRTMHG